MEKRSCVLVSVVSWLELLVPEWHWNCSPFHLVVLHLRSLRHTDQHGQGHACCTRAAGDHRQVPQGRPPRAGCCHPWTQLRLHSSPALDCACRLCATRFQKGPVGNQVVEGPGICVAHFTSFLTPSQRKQQSFELLCHLPACSCFSSSLMCRLWWRPEACQFTELMKELKSNVSIRLQLKSQPCPRCFFLPPIKWVQ